MTEHQASQAVHDIEELNRQLVRELRWRLAQERIETLRRMGILFARSREDAGMRQFSTLILREWLTMHRGAERVISELREHERACASEASNLSVRRMEEELAAIRQQIHVGFATLAEDDQMHAGVFPSPTQRTASPRSQRAEISVVAPLFLPVRYIAWGFFGSITFVAACSVAITINTSLSASGGAIPTAQLALLITFVLSFVAFAIWPRSRSSLPPP